MTLNFTDALCSLTRFIITIDIELLYHSNLIKLDYFDGKIREDYQNQSKYTWTMYVSISKYGLNREIPQLEQLYKIVGNTKNQLDSKFLFNHITRALQVSSTFNHNWLIQNLVNQTKNMDQAVKIYNEAIKEFPRWEFKGDPISIVDFSKVVESVNDDLVNE